MTSPVYQLKITLRGFRPPIWRRVLIAADATFFDLHSLIQDAFDWQDYHLHSFRGKRLDGKERIYIEDPENSAEMMMPKLVGFPDELMQRQDEFFDEYKTKLYQHLNPDYPRLRYDYDFGDNWEHDIVLESSDHELTRKVPVVVAGKGMAPPEDSRGWIEHAEEIVSASKKSKFWQEWLAEWGEQTMEDFFYYSTVFLCEEFDPSEVKITNPTDRLKGYDEP